MPRYNDETIEKLEDTAYRIKVLATRSMAEGCRHIMTGNPVRPKKT